MMMYTSVFLVYVFYVEFRNSCQQIDAVEVWNNIVQSFNCAVRQLHKQHVYTLHVHVSALYRCAVLVTVLSE